MSRRSRLFTVILSALVVAFGAVTLSAIPASATHSSSCSGSLIATEPVINDRGQLIANANIYYSSANGGTNCMKVVLASGHAGITHNMQALIHVCNVRSPCQTYSDTSPTRRDGDSGNFSSYAGPVHVTGTDGRCIRLYALAGGHGHQTGVFTTGSTGVWCG